MKDYTEKPLDKWNVNDFLKFFGDEHVKRFKIEYQPMGSWSAERGQVARIIGTQKKAGMYSKEVFKRFLDEELANYKPTYSYPGLNIGFLITYRKQTLQKFAAEEKRKENDQVTEVDESVTDWFLK